MNLILTNYRSPCLALSWQFGELSAVFPYQTGVSMLSLQGITALLLSTSPYSYASSHACYQSLVGITTYHNPFSTVLHALRVALSRSQFELLPIVSVESPLRLLENHITFTTRLPLTGASLNCYAIYSRKLGRTLATSLLFIIQLSDYSRAYCSRLLQLCSRGL